MKKIFALMLALVLMLCGSAFATGTALPDESDEVIVVEEPGSHDLTAFLGAHSSEYELFFIDNNIERPDPDEVKTKSASYTNEDGENKSAIAGIHVYIPGFSVFGFEVNGTFDGELSEEMTADGWVVDKRLYEGGLFYNYIKKSYGEAVCQIYMSTDGGKITFLSVTIDNLEAYFAAVKEEAQP